MNFLSLLKPISLDYSASGEETEIDNQNDLDETPLSQSMMQNTVVGIQQSQSAQKDIGSETVQSDNTDTNTNTKSKKLRKNKHDEKGPIDKFLKSNEAATPQNKNPKRQATTPVEELYDRETDSPRSKSKGKT